MPEPSIIDARLAEIDRRLRIIQSGLESVPRLAGEAAESPPPSAPSALSAPSAPSAPSVPSAPPAPSAPPTPQSGPPTALRAAPSPRPPSPEPEPAGDEGIAELASRLRELTAVQERLLTATQDLLVEHADVLSRVTPTFGVSAGPFTDTAALQDFQRALAELPQVRDVAVREYTGSEGAVLDVHLWPSIS